MRRSCAVGAVAALALLTPAPAPGKEFRPGDLRICNATRCAPILNRSVLPALAAFYYTGLPPARVGRPALGTPHYELRFRNGP